MSRIRANTITNQNANGAPNFPDGITVPDNGRIVLGISSDLSIYHDSSNSRIVDSGTGDLKIQGSRVAIDNAAGTATQAIFTEGADVKLYHNDALKFATTSGGVSVTGTVAATSYTGDGSALTGIDASSLKNGSDIKVQANASGAVVTGILSTGTNAVAIPSIEADILIIGGGGAPGTTGGEGGGGGAGGFQEYNSAYLVKGKVYTVTIGGGGGGTSNYAVRATRGAPSSIKGANLQCIPSAGGGPGATYPAQTPTGKGFGIGGDGASGGGGGGNYNANSERPMHYGGKGIGGQGTDGGDGMYAGGAYGGGGGGGAGQAGGSGNNSNGNAGNGGNGLQSDITGSNVFYAGGGAGNSTATDGSGGQGGGGATNTSGTANTGGGGGAGNNVNGGSGVVIIRVLTTDYSGTTSGSPTVTTDGSHKVIKFTGSGTYTA